MWSRSQTVTARAALLTALLALMPACASPAPSKIEVFLTRDRRVVARPATVIRGETIITVENDDGRRHHPMLARLHPGTKPDALPLIAGAVASGKPSETVFEGSGYTVITKLDSMAAYFNGPNRVRATIHEYLRTGTYVLFCDLPGHYSAGEFAAIRVGEPTRGR